MKHSYLTLLFAAALILGVSQAVKAEDSPEVDEQEYSQEMAPCPAWGMRFGPHGFRSGHDSWRDGPGHRGGGGHAGRQGRKGPHHGDFGIGFGGARAFDVLNLDEAQKTKMVDVLTNNFRARLEARLALADAQRALRDLYDDDSADADAIVAANAALGEARGKMDVLTRKFREDVKGVLTEEQVKKLEDMRGDRFEKRDRDGKKDGKRPGGPGERRGPRPEGGPGSRR